MRNSILIVSSALALLTLSWLLKPSTHSSEGTADSPPQPVAAAPAAPAAPPAASPQPPAADLTTPTEPLTEEQRRAAEIHALVREGRVGHARALTDRFYRDFPDSPEIPALERLTGYHPRPYGPR